MKRRIDIAMDKLITTIVLIVILSMFMALVVVCNQPIEENCVEPIRCETTSPSCDALPLVVRDEPMEAITEIETEAETETKIEAPIDEGIQMTLKAYAYCPCIKCCGKDDGITATGTKATSGRTIAVDSSVIPYGSRVVIDGHIYVAEDCGGAIKGYTIDVFHDTHKEALQWGIKYVDAVVYIAERGK
jgi:3D (Asp-Asp-Asp) domain-containing protein